MPPGGFEFQMLYGMAEPIKSALVDLGQRVRVYTPFGQLLPGMAYLVRRLLENTSNESFLRAGFQKHLPEEQLLMNPARPPLRRIAASRASDVRRRHRSINPTAVHRVNRAFRNEPHGDFSREENRRRCAMRCNRWSRYLGGDLSAGDRRQPVEPGSVDRFV